jgi:glycine/D-amino acid oxidase-like deaminating enzyme
MNIRRGFVDTDKGSIATKYIVQATEGYTSQLANQHRNMVPLYSMMIATEPLTDDVWATIGLSDRPTFDDTRHLIVYGQRTADGRFAFGGRGAPYHFGSAIKPTFDTNNTMRNRIHQALIELFPTIRDAKITHHWGGPLGIPRNWACSVNANWEDGVITAGGYVGDGVSATNLFGRIVADLIASRELDHGQHSPSELLRLPVVGPLSRRWEPEPIRWIGINSGRLAARIADRSEERTGRKSRFWGGFIDGLLRR